MEKTLYTVTVYSENQVGLLNQVTIVFTRRQVNIESLTVSRSAIPGVHKFTITANTDRETIRKIVLQIEKRIDVLKAYYYTDNNKMTFMPAKKGNSAQIAKHLQGFLK